jgi:putative transposase
VVADDHAGLRATLREAPPGAFVQRCHVHFLRDALDHLPREADDGCLQELRWLHGRRELAEAKADLAAWLKERGARYDRLTGRVEEDLEETFTCYRLPRRRHKRMKGTNVLERLSEAIERRTHAVRIFPNAGSRLRLVRALAVGTRENWLEANRCLNVDDLGEQKKLQLREAA